MILSFIAGFVAGAIFVIYRLVVSKDVLVVYKGKITWKGKEYDLKEVVLSNRTI